MKESIGSRLVRLRTAIKTVFGMPDYEAYLERHRRVHPEKEPLSRREYYAEYLKHRYESGGPTRCC
ncbi:MAG: YbdD/YjiX family protein [Alicyclobacillaceae bacterium]|nr:YbdD/YjiX family protein [Alicyclobacillaceae bacterium]